MNIGTLRTGQVRWSDEFRMTLWSSATAWVWRQEGERYMERHVVPVRQFDGGSVMFGGTSDGEELAPWFPYEEL
jgi:hypothetical protein